MERALDAGILTRIGLILWAESASVRSNWNTDSNHVTGLVKGIMGSAKEMAVKLHTDFMECAWGKRQVEDDGESNEDINMEWGRERHY
jgi:hypothetical protein